MPRNQSDCRLPGLIVIFQIPQNPVCKSSTSGSMSVKMIDAVLIRRLYLRLGNVVQKKRQPQHLVAACGFHGTQNVISHG